MNAEHNRQKAWCRAFCGMGVKDELTNTRESANNMLNGGQDVEFFLHLHRFMNEVVPFNRLYPAGELLKTHISRSGQHPLVLSSANLDIVAVYIPGNTTFILDLDPEKGYMAQWYNPRTGSVKSAHLDGVVRGIAVTTPSAQDEADQESDWVLVLSLPFIQEI